MICQPLPHPTFREQRRFRAIYHAAFPAAQRKPTGYLLRSVRGGDITLLVARDPGARHRIVSFATLAPLSGTAALYLGYLATDPAFQNRGIGGQLFDYLIAHAAARPEVGAVVWEVEPPQPDDPAHLHNRRIRFYERHGAQIITQAQTYRVPNDTSRGTVPQRLMWIPAQHPAPPDYAAPSRDTLAAWITAIFRDIYIDADDLCSQILAELHHGA